MTTKPTLFTRTSTQCCRASTARGGRRLPSIPPQVISGFSSSPSVSTKPHGRRDEPAPDGSTELACRPAPGAGNGPRSARHPASGLGEPACSAAWSGRAPAVCPHTASQPRGRETRTASSRRASVGDLAVLVTGRSARTGRVSRWWRVPAGTHPWVALAVMTPVPGTARIGDADTTPSHTDGPVGSQNEGIPMVQRNSFLEGPFASAIEAVVTFMCTCAQRPGPSCCGEARVQSDGS
jgi:hypothetical protein